MFRWDIRSGNIAIRQRRQRFCLRRRNGCAKHRPVRRESPDWKALGALYDRLFAITQSPVVALNRAIVIAELQGPKEALAVLDVIGTDVSLQDYQPYWAARAELLARLSDTPAADDAYLRAIGLESDPAVREFLESRRQRLGLTSRP